jgi:hypothetical protein
MAFDPELQSLGGETICEDQDELLGAGSSKAYRRKVFVLSTNK